MRKLLMLGSSYGTVEMLRYAKSIGVYTIVTDYNEPEHSSGKQISDEYWMISTADIDALERKCREEGVDAVFSPVSEFNLDRNIELCRRLNLPFYCSEEAWHYSRNKRAFKDACIRNGVPVAEDYYLTDALTQEELSQVRYPVVVKPNNLCGSKGVSFCYNQEELIAAYRYARKLSADKTIIVERMLEGRGFTAHYVLAEGEIHQVNLIEELVPDGCNGTYYTVDTSLTDCVERVMSEISPSVEKALKNIGCKEGFAWIELILDKDNRFYALELGYRLGGDMVERTYPMVFKFNAYKWMVDLALGRKHTASELPPEQQHMPKACGCSYLLRSRKSTSIREIIGIEQALLIPGVSYTQMRQNGDSIKESLDAGVFTITAENPIEFCDKIRQINDLVHIIDVDGDDILYRYDNYDHLMELYARGTILQNADRSTIIEQS